MQEVAEGPLSVRKIVYLVGQVIEQGCHANVAAWQTQVHHPCTWLQQASELIDS